MFANIVGGEVAIFSLNDDSLLSWLVFRTINCDEDFALAWLYQVVGVFLVCQLVSVALVMKFHIIVVFI